DHQAHPRDRGGASGRDPAERGTDRPPRGARAERAGAAQDQPAFPRAARPRALRRAAESARHSPLRVLRRSLMAEAQTHATHRRYYPLYHFVVLPLVLLNVVVRVVYAFRHAGASMVWWEVILAVAMAMFAWLVRVM